MAARPPGVHSRWTGEFLDADQEQAFQAETWPRLCRQLRLVAALAGSVYLLALYLNWKGLGGGAGFRTMLGLRVFTAGALWGIAWASRPDWPRRRAELLILAAILCMVGTRLVEGHLGAPAARPGTPMVLPVMPLILFAVIAVPAWLALVWGGVGSLLFLRDQVALWGAGAHSTQVAFIYLLLANGTGYTFRVAWNRITRRDFTLRQALEREVAERQRAEQEARAAEAAKGRFLAVVSHELRTPLNSFLGGAQLLQDTDLGPDQRHLVRMLARSGEQLAQLLDDVLALARFETGRLDLAAQPFSPEALLDTVHAVIAPQARAKGLDWRVERPAALPAALVGDALRLRQVLINLAANAVKFTSSGSVVLALALAEAAGAGTLDCAFSVRDTGPGLDPETQARVFLPFERGAQAIRGGHEGAGLGLAISRELVAGMGGELRVASTPGAGSAFSFSVVLPVGETPAEGPRTPACALSVLVVDDLEANRIVAAGLLAGLGHRAVSVAGGAAALEALRAEAFDAVLLDLNMAELDGLQTLQGIRALEDPRLAALPVFLTTAEGDSARVRACLDASIQGVAAKPLRRPGLAALLGPVEAGFPLVDEVQVAGVIADLGAGTWAAGLCACRTSARACLEELASGPAAPALHRLAGLSATYGMVRLHRLVRQAERRQAEGAACPLDPLSALVEASLAQLEGGPGAPASDQPDRRDSCAGLALPS